MNWRIDKEVVRIIIRWGSSISQQQQLAFEEPQTPSPALAASQCSPVSTVPFTPYLDGFRIVDSYGNLLTPTASSSLTDPFYPGTQFTRSSNYLLSQWLDVEDPLFISWFMRSSLNEKTMLVGGANNLSAGTYTVVIYNNFEADKKRLFVRTVNGFGGDNLVLGFSLLAVGKKLMGNLALAMFVAMVCLCFHRKRSENI